MVAGSELSLRMQGTIPGVVPGMVEVRVQSRSSTPLPAWLRAYAFVSSYLCPTVECAGDACVVHRVQWNGSLECISPLIDFEAWVLRAPYLPAVPLVSIIGMSPVHVVIQQGDREFGRLVVQRRQHCSHMHH